MGNGQENKGKRIPIEDTATQDPHKEEGINVLVKPRVNIIWFLILIKKLVLMIPYKNQRDILTVLK